jgi:hypothetical protein
MDGGNCCFSEGGATEGTLGLGAGTKLQRNSDLQIEAKCAVACEVVEAWTRGDC